MTPLRVQGRLARFLKASLHLPGQHRVKIPYHSVICTSQYFRRTLASSSQVPSREGTGPDNSEAKRLGRPTRPTTGAIRTLCPANLTREDYLTVYRWRDHPTLTFYVLLPHGARHVTVHFPMVESLQLTSGSDRGGFLYYHRPSRAPPLAGEIRFRLTPSPEPTSFSAGVDLTNKSGTPWRISLPSIPTCESWDPFGVLLNEVDKTVSEEVMTLARESGGLRTTCSGDSYVTRCLYAFGQPFEFSLDQKWHTFTLVGKDALLRANLPRISCAPTKRGHKQYPQQSPFSGTIICCFEPSPLPEHNAKRVVVMRVLRTLESDPVRPNPSYTGPQYPQELMPRAGQLLLRLRLSGKVIPWAYNVDKCPPLCNVGEVQHNGGPLRVLFDNAIPYSSDM